MRKWIVKALQGLASKISGESVTYHFANGENIGPPFLITLQFETLNEAMNYMEQIKDDPDWLEAITMH